MDERILFLGSLRVSRNGGIRCPRNRFLGSRKWNLGRGAAGFLVTSLFPVLSLAILVAIKEKVALRARAKGSVAGAALGTLRRTAV